MDPLGSRIDSSYHQSTMNSKILSCIKLICSPVPKSFQSQASWSSRSVLACQPAASRRTCTGKSEALSSDMEGKEEKPPQPGAERVNYRKDMEASYGEAYSTRSSDEGYGEIYGEAVKRYQSTPDLKENQRGMTAERDQKADAFEGTKSGDDYDTTQGHPVAEKEKARHAKHEHAFEHETKPKHGAAT